MSFADSAPRITVVGSVNLDTFVSTPTLPGPGQTVLGLSQVHTPGGKGANQAVAAALLGAQVTFIAALGPDAAAQAVLAALAARHLDLTHIARVDAPTGAAIVSVAASGENSIIVISGANAALQPAHVAAAAASIRAADVVVLQAEIPLAATQAAIDLAAASGTPIILNLAPVPPDPRPWLSAILGCDVLILNEGEEAALLAATGGKLHALGPELIITTLGPRGARWWHKGTEDTLPALTPEGSIIDTVGAGDAFVGAFVTRWTAARIAGTPLDQTVLRDILRWAMAAGALACTRPGAIESLPGRTEVVALLRRG